MRVFKYVGYICIPNSENWAKRMLRLKILSKFNPFLKGFQFLLVANAIEYTFVEFLISANMRSAP